MFSAIYMCVLIYVTIGSILTFTLYTLAFSKIFDRQAEKSGEKAVNKLMNTRRKLNNNFGKFVFAGLFAWPIIFVPNKGKKQ